MVYQKQLVTVKNLNGTKDNEPPLGYDSWIEYWETKVGHKAIQCGKLGCKTKNNLVGAHVKKVDNNDDKHYIIPLCKGCNNLRNENFIIYSELVPVNQK